MNRRMGQATLLVLLAAAGWSLSPAGAAALDVTIDEWPVPWADTRPRDPYPAPDGRIWFVGQRGHYLATLDPTDGTFERFPLEPATGPHNVIVDRTGAPWYAGNLARHIGRMDARTGTIHKITMPDPAARDPHTLTFDGAGNIWFTVQGGNFVGRLTPVDESVALVPVPTPQARPYGIVVDHAGTVWAVAFGTNKLLRIDPASLALTEIALPDASARPRRLQTTRDGAVWYADYADGKLGRFDPATGTLRNWSLPGGAASRPYGMAVDAADRLWVAETGTTPNRLVVFDPAMSQFVAEAEVPSGGGTIRHMQYDGATDVVWFGTDTNTIGRARIGTGTRAP